MTAETFQPRRGDVTMGTKLQQEVGAGLRFLDDPVTYLENPKTVNQGMELLYDGLMARRSEMAEGAWRCFCEHVCVVHPIREKLHQDPLTRRSFCRPRGYPGDAILLDFIYKHPANDSEIRKASPVGKAIHDYVVSRPAAESVRWRRNLLADLIDETAERIPGAEILSVACGHLREASFSTAVQKGLVGRLVAFDQDDASLENVEAEKNGSNIECVHGNIKALITNKANLGGTFDLIYSAGLYDYLSDGAARVLTKSLFGLLKPRGRLLIANFLPSNSDSAYMEAFMGWQLLYRTREQFERVVGNLANNIQRIYYDDNWHVIYLELMKR